MSDSTAPKPAPPRANPVWLAAVLGGLLGGVCAFGLARALPPTPKPPPDPPPSEARQFAEHVLGKLRDGKNDEFVTLIRPAFVEMAPADFAALVQNTFKVRADAARPETEGGFGPGGEFEFCRETVLGPTLVRVAFLEKHARGCVLWVLVVYNSPGGWQVAGFRFETPISGFPALR
jgi:hypothetical protein